MEGCTFCKIATGALPADRVFEDEECLAFLDIRPFAPGHTLVIPKEHHASIAEMPGEAFARSIGAKLGRIGRAVAEASGADGFNVFVANGAAAGQEIFHLHVHLVPRRDGDDIRFAPAGGGGATTSPELAAAIRKAVEASA